MKKRSKKKFKQKFSIIVIAALVFLAAIILWSGFKKKSSAPKAAPKPPAASNSKGPTSSAQIFFASNGKNTIYKIKKGDKWSVIWNGKEGKEYDFVSNPTFSPDGTNFAYNAELGGQAYVVVNNTQEIYAYMKASYIVFSQNNQVIAFVAATSDNTYIVITNQFTDPNAVSNESAPIDQIGTMTDGDGDTVAIVVSGDGSQVAYIVEDDDGQVTVIINGEEAGTYDSIDDFILNDDGTYSYEGQDGDTTVTVENGEVTSTTEDQSDTTPDTTTPPDDDDDDSSSETPSYDNYKYKISTDKDIDNSENDDLDYSGCTNPNGCNF